MNILSTNGIVGRYVTDWSGPGAVLTDVNIRLGAPNYPDDTMTLSGSVTAKDEAVGADGKGGVEVTLRGANGLGDHVTGTVRLLLPSRGTGSDSQAERCGPMSGTDHSFAGNTAIVGIGATEFSKESGRSELRLAVEAVDLALRDAGIEPAEVDGLVTFSSDTNPEIEIARSLGMGELSFFSRIHYGGGAGCATIQQAAMAVHVGRGRRRGLLPGVQRAIGQPVRDRRAGPCRRSPTPRRPTSPGTRRSGCSRRPSGWPWRPSATCT